LTPGNYTVVSIADFRDGLGGAGYKFWNIENELNIQDLSITENDSYLPVVFETLGIDIQKIEITNASKSITELFLNLEEERYTQMVLNDMLKLEEKTELYVSIPPESEFYVEVPDGEKDTVASLISDLLVKGILKIATVTEPNTQRTCSLEQYLSESYSVQIETLTFDVVKTKDSWRLADKKAVMPRDYATYIKQAAQNVYDTNKKAKKQTVELRKLRIINNNGWDNARIKIWHVQKDIANPDKNKYVLL
jgi:hypothetical protein